MGLRSVLPHPFRSGPQRQVLVQREIQVVGLGHLLRTRWTAAANLPTRSSMSSSACSKASSVPTGTGSGTDQCSRSGPVTPVPRAPCHIPRQPDPRIASRHRVRRAHPLERQPVRGATAIAVGWTDQQDGSRPMRRTRLDAPTQRLPAGPGRVVRADEHHPSCWSGEIRCQTGKALGTSRTYERRRFPPSGPARSIRPHQARADDAPAGSTACRTCRPTHPAPHRQASVDPRSLAGTDRPAPHAP